MLQNKLQDFCCLFYCSLNVIFVTDFKLVVTRKNKQWRQGEFGSAVLSWRISGATIQTFVQLYYEAWSRTRRYHRQVRNVKLVIWQNPKSPVVVSIRNGAVERIGRPNVCVWQTWQGCYLRILPWSLLKNTVLGSLTKDPYFNRRWSLTEMFSKIIISCSSYKICRLLSLAVLLRTFTRYRTKPLNG